MRVLTCLSLASFDNLRAILVVAVAGYGEALNWTAIAFASHSLDSVKSAARIWIRSATIYFLP